MTETIAEAGPFERLLRLELTEAEIDAAKAGAARRLSKDLKIPGFRPGKAPRPVVEAALGAGRLRTEAIEELIPKKLGSILEEAQLSPAVTPTLEKVDDAEGGVTAEVRVTLWPELDNPPAYKDRTIEIDAPELSEADLEASLQRMREQFASLETVERPAGMGDYVSVDIHATSGDDPVAETTAEEVLYEVGSGLLVEGIDEHLIGTEPEQEISFPGVLPSGFGDRAGESVTFHVKVNEVKARVLPELDDEWVNEVTEFDTIEELKSELTERLTVTKRRAVANRFRQRALDGLVDEAQVDLPEALVRAEMDDLFHRFAHQLEENDITIADYLQASGIDQERFLDDLRSQAGRSIRTRLVLEAVAKAEGLEVTPEELAGTIEALARSSAKPKEVYEAFSNSSRAMSLAGDILRNKALEAIVASARAVDSDGRTIDLGPTESEPMGQGFEEGSVELSEAEAVEAEVVEAEVVEAEIVEAEIVGQES
ncbi:MAG TPA: trigger factor [Acidimicrobiia bacterium]|nr:trigger factor [Acidimicrobiia bacterium]